MTDTYPPFTCANDSLDKPARLRQMMREDGYLFVKGVGPRDKLLKLRADVLSLCAEAGWLDPQAPLMDGRWNGAKTHTEGEPDYMTIYRAVVNLKSFKDVPEDAGLIELMGKLIDGPVLLHRRKIGRITFPSNVSQTTGAHQDWHYIRGTPETYTMWMPVGDCPAPLGGLAVLRGSHRGGYVEHVKFSIKKYASAGLGDEQLPTGPGIAWHAGDFELGDALIFHSHTIHKALPNLTPDRLRLSIDNRYQRDGDAIDAGSMGTHYGF